jgi:hypothetical protein
MGDVFPTSSLTIQGALAEIDGLATCIAMVRLIELIRENLFFLAALGACANKRLQMLMAFEAWAVLRCGHNLLLLGADRFCGSRLPQPVQPFNRHRENEFYLILGSLPLPAQSGV